VTLWESSRQAIDSIREQWDIWGLLAAKSEVSEALGHAPRPWPAETVPDSQGRRLMCVAMAQGDIEQAHRYYTEWDQVELYRWRSLQMASSYSPPSEEDVKKAAPVVAHKKREAERRKRKQESRRDGR
jgi:hypothetical protein